MRETLCLALLGMLMAIPAPALAELNPSAYETTTQEELVKTPTAHSGKRYAVKDDFQFCGSDFCVQLHRTKINTKDYYCFTLGSLCLVRMYLKKDHPQAPLLLTLKKGDKVTVYGTFDYMGSDYRYMVVDHMIVERKK